VYDGTVLSSSTFGGMQLMIEFLILGFIDTVAKEIFRSRTRGRGSAESHEDAPGS
jgi:hypothetical protein